jgi:Trypsin
MRVSVILIAAMLVASFETADAQAPRPPSLTNSSGTAVQRSGAAKGQAVQAPPPIFNGAPVDNSSSQVQLGNRGAVKPFVIFGAPAPVTPPLVQTPVAGAVTTYTEAIPGPNAAAPDNPFNLVVEITYQYAGGKDLCTGTLIDATHVLTAGHCGCGQDYTISFGAGSSAQKVDIAGSPILFDTQVCQIGPGGGNDLALLVLTQGITCPVVVTSTNATQITAGAPNTSTQAVDCRSAAARSSSTAPAMTFGYPPDPYRSLMPLLQKGTKLTVAGYGYTQNYVLGQLMQAAIPIASVACLEPQLEPYCAPFAEMILAQAAGTSNRTDTCQGDSGGPAFLIGPFGYELVAVTSRPAPGVQDNTDLHCGGGGIYTILGRALVTNWFKANGIQAAHPIQ